MSDFDDAIAILLEKSQRGDMAARQELFDKYAHVFLRVIRLRLENRLRSIFDSYDFMQEARLVLFTKKIAAGAFATPESFLKYISKAAANKVKDANHKSLGKPNTTSTGKLLWTAPQVRAADV